MNGSRILLLLISIGTLFLVGCESTESNPTEATRVSNGNEVPEEIDGTYRALSTSSCRNQEEAQNLFDARITNQKVEILWNLTPVCKLISEHPLVSLNSTSISRLRLEGICAFFQGTDFSVESKIDILLQIHRASKNHIEISIGTSFCQALEKL